MRICSLLPSATEMLYALGLGDDVVAVSSACDYPPEVSSKPRVVRTTIDPRALSSEQIDQAVRASGAGGEPLYDIDVPALIKAAPELIVTQALCRVCAVDAGRVLEAVDRLARRPQILSLHPHTLDEMLHDLVRIGELVGRAHEAQALVERCRGRLDALQQRLRGTRRRPRVCCLEWLEPLMVSGHWIPEMVERAGGLDVFGRRGKASRRISVQEFLGTPADALVLMPCGFSIEQTRREVSQLISQPWWPDLPAVCAGQVFLVDGPSYFHRAGPRCVDGIEVLAGLLHPERCADLMPARAFERLSISRRHIARHLG